MSVEDIKNFILERIKEAVFKIFNKKINGLDLIYPPDVFLGDFSFECFPLAKELKESPENIAKKIAANISLAEPIEAAQAVGPYLNFKFDGRFLLKEILSEIFSQKEDFGNSKIGEEKLVIVEYLSPNTNKPLHLGHVRNGVLGMAIVNLLESVGYKVIKANLINDRGIHICQSMLAWKKWANGETPESVGIKGDHFVGKWYVRYHQEASKNPQLEEEARELLKKWEMGDPETIELWKTMNNWVYQGFEETYKELGLKFDVFDYESETYKLGKKIVEDGLKKGIFKKSEDGAIIVELPDGQKITLIRKDGTSVYITQDLGTAESRFKRFNPEKLIYVVGVEQEFHFKTLFKILEMLGFERVNNLRHLSYGMVNLPEGKMKSREGKVVDADDLIEGMKELALEEILKRYQKISKEEAMERAKKIGVGAIKFYLLRVKPNQEINYNPEESISFEGFTGPYVQYAYARASAILKKAESEKAEKDKESGVMINHNIEKEELILLRYLIQFPEKIRAAANDFNPAILAEHLFETAKAFNHFYSFCPVLTAKDENLIKTRLALVKATLIVLKKGLNLLGIEELKEM